MLGPRIKKYLESKGISQAFVADKINVKSNVFNCMMNGNRKITAEEYHAICKVLDLPLTTFLEESA